MSQMNHNMAAGQYNANPCEIQKFMATEIQHRSMRERLKFGHIYQTYSVDLCHIDSNLSIDTDIQCGSIE